MGERIPFPSGAMVAPRALAIARIIGTRFLRLKDPSEARRPSTGTVTPHPDGGCVRFRTVCASVRFVPQRGMYLRDLDGWRELVRNCVDTSTQIASDALFDSFVGRSRW